MSVASPAVITPVAPHVSLLAGAAVDTIDGGANLLAGVRLFRALDTKTLSAIARTGVYRRYSPLEQIIDRDGRSTDVFFLVRGRARIVNYSMSGREVAFDDLHEGDHFGELAALDDGPRSANVMALVESLLFALPQRAFRNVLASHPPIALQVMTRLVGIVRACDERIMDLSTLAAQNRVQAELLRQVRRQAATTNCGRISPIPVHSDIASRVSTTRETVARVLNDLARRGIVERTKQSLVIHDIARLETLVEDVRS
mgnify:CR=1 FL=1